LQTLLKVVAGGKLIVDSEHEVGPVLDILRQRSIFIEDSEGCNIMFIMRKDSVHQVMKEVACMKALDHVIKVHVTYYSHERR